MGGYLVDASTSVAIYATPLVLGRSLSTNSIKSWQLELGVAKLYRPGVRRPRDNQLMMGSFARGDSVLRCAITGNRHLASAWESTGELLKLGSASLSKRPQPISSSPTWTSPNFSDQDSLASRQFCLSVPELVVHLIFSVKRLYFLGRHESRRGTVKRGVHIPERG